MTRGDPPRRALGHPRASARLANPWGARPELAEDGLGHGSSEATATMPRTRIRKLHLVGVRQFRDVTLDFTHPETGEALDRICLIGRNGTGKSTVLDVLHRYIVSKWRKRVLLPEGSKEAVSGIEIEHENRHLLVTHENGGEAFFLDITECSGEGARLVHAAANKALEAERARVGAERLTREFIIEEVRFRAGRDLIINCPAEVPTNQAAGLNDVPNSDLNQALALFKQDFPLAHSISNEKLSEMWRVLIFLTKKREADRETFERLPENLRRMKLELIEEFDQRYPSPLHALARLWDRILEPAGLEFDIEHATLPVQLTDNLLAYIRLRGSGQQVPYAHLSTGIRNFLFRIGHLFLLYFNREIDHGFLFVDEPENSLFPDFLFDLMEIYEQILRTPAGTRTQAFFATHSPLVAAQFEPHERIVLEWDDEGGVTAGKGTAPKGDDPNDVLRQDFHLPELMGPEGRRKWKEYLDLRRQIRTAPSDKKVDLVARALEIGRSYGFEPPSS